MAAGDYTAIPVLDVIEELGDNESNMFKMFQKQEKGNLEALRCFTDNADGCYPTNVLRQKLIERTDPDTSIYIDVNQTTTAGVGTQFVRQGTGGQTRVQVELVKGTYIEEGFEISRVNEMLGRFSSYSIEDRVRYSMGALIAEKIENIFTRLNAQARTYLDTNKWASGGVGTRFSAAGDYKEIPSGEDDKLFLKIQQEVFENKLNGFGGGASFDVVGSAGSIYLEGLTRAYGPFAERFTGQFLENINWYMDSELAVPTPATDEAVFYTIARNGIGVIAHAHRFAGRNTVFQTGEDSWSIILPPQLPMLEGIRADLFEINLKGFKGYADNFATYANNESRIDIIEAMSMVVTPYFYRAYSPTTREPIVGYKKLK